MSSTTRFIIRALPALVGFMVGAFVVLVIVSAIGLYGTLATVLSIAAGVGVGFLGFRIGTGIADRRERGAYGDPGYPPQEQEYDQPYRRPDDRQGYGYQRHDRPGDPYGDYPPYQR